MAVDTDEDVNGASSDAIKAAEAAAGSQPAEDDNRGSSPGGDNSDSPPEEQGEKKPGSALEAATAAIAADDAAKAETEEEADKPDAEGAAKDKKEGAEEAPADEDFEEPTGLSEKAQNRFQKLARRAKDAESKLSERDARISELEPKAENFGRLESYLNDHGITPEETRTGLTIMGLMKTDPAKALEMLKPQLEMLNAFVGNTLPADVQAMVDSGEVTEAAARELVLARNERERLAKANQSQQQQTESERQKQEADRVTAEIRTALNAFEADVKAKTPGYDKVRGLFINALKSELADTKPTTAADTKACAQRAWDSLQATLREFGVSPKPAVDPVTTGGKSPGNNEPAPPKSALEAAKRAIAG